MRHELFGIRIDDESLEDLYLRLEDWIIGDEARVIVTPNAEFLLEALRNSSFAKLLHQSDLAVADSVSLQYAVVALGNQRLKHRIPGVDLLECLCEIAVRHKVRVLLLGGNSGAAEASSQKFKQRFELLDVVALDPGLISWRNNYDLDISNSIVEQINTFTPVIVAVALGQHKQEQFIKQIKEQCPSVRIWIGVGGALEMVSGQKRRAPHVMSRLGFEWIWRLLIEPSRVGRIFNASIVFPLLVVVETFRRGTFIRSTHKVFSEFYRQWFI